jgi:hypothetical protein
MMPRRRGMKLFGVMLGLVLFVSLAGSDRAAAADRNKCGCYKDGAGTCFCDKKAKCGCPGDCEPKGCDEARNKELQKEIEAETKKAEARDKAKTTALPETRRRPPRKRPATDCRPRKASSSPS